MKSFTVSYKIASLCICVCCFFNEAKSQLINDGGDITIQSNGLIFASDSITNTNSGTITNMGEIVVAGNILNSKKATLSGSGVYSIQGNFNNSATYRPDSSVLNFYGSTNSALKNKGGNIYILQVNKDPDHLVNLLDNERVINSVNFLSDSNWIQLNDNMLTLNANCKINSFSSSRYFITNGNGSLRKLKVKNKAFVFPTGFDKQTYNRLTITENGTADAYSVRCTAAALLGGDIGNPISTGGIEAGWVISEDVAGGGNATIVAQWKKNTDELPGFDYTKCMVVRYANNGWDFSAAQAVTATGNVYRSVSRSGFSNFGYFTVLSTGNPSFAGLNYIGSNSTNDAAAGNKNLKIYPTLVQNDFTVYIPVPNKQNQKMNITVANAAGKIVLRKTNVDFTSQKVFLPNLVPGLYIVTVDYDNNKFMQKIVIER
jgi:hypothetical protein